MSKARSVGEVVYKRAASGFIIEGAWAYIPEHNAPRDEQDWCVFEACRGSDCVEWVDLWLLPGVTRQEAEAALARREFDGMACHVPECELLDEPESPDESERRIATLRRGLSLLAQEETT